MMLLRYISFPLATLALANASVVLRRSSSIAKRDLGATFDDHHSSGLKTSGNTTGVTTAAEEPFECSSSVTQDSAQLEYLPVYPWQLDYVQWTGSGMAECTIVMFSIEYTLYAIDPVGGRNPIASGSCFGCELVEAIDTAYRCTQDPNAGGCDGEWQLSLTVIFEAPPGDVFIEGSAGCVIEGPLLSCTQTVVAGMAQRWNVNLPEGVPMAVLSPASIVNIRDTHFPGGAAVDNSKGLFLSSITNAQLETIFETGMVSSLPWTDATAGAYLQKTFPVSGVGTSSPQSGGGPSSSVTLVINRFGDAVDDRADVITMYPN